MYSTAYNLWTFTWFVHFELTFRLKGTDKIHTEGLSKFHSNIYSILFGCQSDTWYGLLNAMKYYKNELDIDMFSVQWIRIHMFFFPDKTINNICGSYSWFSHLEIYKYMLTIFYFKKMFEILQNRLVKSGHVF